MFCKKCGGGICWDKVQEKFIFHPADDCLCEVPYPKDFLNLWVESYIFYNIDDMYEIWKAGREAFMTDICERHASIYFDKSFLLNF
jgi:hypothetical protein